MENIEDSWGSSACFLEARVVLLVCVSVCILVRVCMCVGLLVFCAPTQRKLIKEKKKFK